MLYQHPPHHGRMSFLIPRVLSPQQFIKELEAGKFPVTFFGDSGTYLGAHNTGDL